MAREQAEKEASQGIQSETSLPSYGSASVASAETPPAVTSVASSTSLAPPTGVALSPVAVTPVASLPNPSSIPISGSSATPTSQSAVTSAVGVQPPVVNAASLNPAISGSTGVSSVLSSVNTTPMYVFLLCFSFPLCADIFRLEVWF